MSYEFEGTSEMR